MSGMPSLVTILKYLRAHPEWADLNDVITATGESQTRAEKTLAKLSESGIIEKDGTRFRFVATEKAETFARKFLELYGKVILAPQLELTLRGILSSIGHPASYLRLARVIEVMEKEGFNREEVVSFLELERSKGHAEMLHVIITQIRPGGAGAIAYQYPSANSIWLRVIPISRIPYPPPLAIATYYMSSSRDVSAEQVARLRDEYLSSRTDSAEEEYIMGVYPPELSEPAVKYLATEKAGMLKALKEEAFQQWFGLRSYW